MDHLCLMLFGKDLRTLYIHPLSEIVQMMA
jgi:hypothetical protein